MKHCPTCNRVESDDALVYCRVDGTPLIGEASSSSEAGTVQLRPPDVTGIATGSSPNIIGARVARATEPTTVLSAQPALTAGKLAKIKQARTAILVTAGVVLLTATAIIVYVYATKESSATIDSIAVAWLYQPPLNSLRDDPRFKDLARRIGMPELK